MGPNSDTGKGTLYINGEPLAEVGRRSRSDPAPL